MTLRLSLLVSSNFGDKSWFDRSKRKSCPVHGNFSLSLQLPVFCSFLSSFFYFFFLFCSIMSVLYSSIFFLLTFSGLRNLTVSFTNNKQLFCLKTIRKDVYENSQQKNTCSKSTLEASIKIYEIYSKLIIKTSGGLHWRRQIRRF